MRECVANLCITAEYPVGSDRAEEHERNGDFDDICCHHAELVPPRWEPVEEPCQERRDALGLVVKWQRCKKNV